MTFTHFDSDLTKARALKVATTPFQRSCLLGGQAWSGSTLTGNAKRARLDYVAEGDSLREEMYLRGFVVEAVKGPRGRREYRISAGTSADGQVYDTAPDTY